MTGKYLIGVDIGTQGTKTAIFSLEGKPVADAFEPSNLIKPAKGVVEQNADEIYGSVMRTISEAVDKSGINPFDVLGIGIDGQMAGMLGIDKEWNAVTHYDSWLDTRCERYIERIKTEAEEKVIGITGCPVTYAHGPKILWWKNERPDIYKRIDKFIEPNTYVVGRMTGLKSDSAYIDYTQLHFSGFGDIEHNRWSDELLSIFGVDRNKMPEVANPWDVVGYLTKETAEECRLVSGIPVVAGCGDQAATSLAAGVTRKGVVFDVAGTASVFSCCVDKYKPDIKNKTLLFPRSIIPGLWIPLAYINGGGLCLKWFIDNLTGTGALATYDELNREAESIMPGSEGLLFLPHFSGRVCPNNPNVRGTWLGLSWVHTRSHMYRAILEGIAYEYNYYLKTLKNLIKDVEFSKVYAIGGGAKSRLFNSIKADVLGIDYTTLRIADTAPLGSAIVAGYGVKVYDDFEKTIDKLVSFDNGIEYDRKRNEEYKKFSDAYEKSFGILSPLFNLITK